MPGFISVSRPRPLDSVSAAGAKPNGLQSLEPRLLFALDPNGFEQLTLEYINRFREDPRADLLRMVNESSLSTNQATSPDSLINGAMNFFDTVGTTLDAQFTGLSSAPPIAFNESLDTAATDHNIVMRDQDTQTHQGTDEDPIQIRIQNAGYTGWTLLGENVFAFTENMWHGHAGFVIDWGTGVDGIQDPAGHRDTLLDFRYREVGIDVLAENNPSTSVGPYLVTQDFGTRSALSSKGYIMGVVINDNDSDAFYDIGEAMAGVTVTADRVGRNETYTTTSMTAGGYQLLVPNGTYDVTFSGGGLNAPITTQIAVSDQNVKYDAINPTSTPAEFAVSDNSAESNNNHIKYTPTTVGQLTNGLQFTLSNSGTQTLEIRNVLLVRSGAGDFVAKLHDEAGQFVSNTQIDIPGGSYATLRLDFTPSQAGKRIADVWFTTNDNTDGENAVTLRIAGEGDLGGNDLGEAYDFGDFGSSDFGQAERINDLLSRLDTRDLYRFDFTEATRIDTKILNLSADTDLQLLDSQGNILQNERNAGLGEERIVANVNAGTYYVRVLRGNDVQDTKFRLVTKFDAPTANAPLSSGGFFDDDDDDLFD